jgi:hypothetical protein
MRTLVLKRLLLVLQLKRERCEYVVRGSTAAFPLAAD